jgi:hypothetical protein
MSAQPENQQMEGVQDPATDVKGKGKAQEGENMEESMDDDSSDESGAEEQVRLFFAHRSAQTNRKTNTIASRQVNVSHDPNHECDAHEVFSFFC